MTNDEKFDEIVQRALTDMGAIRCPVDEYQAALRCAISEFQVALEASGEFQVALEASEKMDG